MRVRLELGTLPVALAADLRLHLAAGLARDRVGATGGCPWLLWSALAAGLAGLALFGLGGYHAGFLTLNHLAAGWPPWIWEWLTVLGDVRVAVAVALLFGLRHPRLFCALILAALVATAVTQGLKPWVAGGRPPAVLVQDSFYYPGKTPGYAVGLKKFDNYGSPSRKLRVVSRQAHTCGESRWTNLRA